MLYKFFLIFFLFLFQNSFCQIEIHIALGDSIPIDISKDMYVFELIENEKIFQLNSEEILSYRFKNPGNYIIHCIENKDFFKNHKHMSGDHENCSLIHLPDSFFVHVDSFKIIFKPETIYFKDEIVCGKSQLNNFIEIQADILTFNNQNVLIPDLKIFTAGIGSEISGKHSGFSSNSKSIKLKYALQGSCSEPTYIQFDFLDQNNNATSIAKAIQKK